MAIKLPKRRRERLNRRKTTLINKADELAEFCDVDVALIIRTRRTGRYFTYTQRRYGILAVRPGEGRERTQRRHRGDLERRSRGLQKEPSLRTSPSPLVSNVSDVEHFVAREAELKELHARLSSDGSRRTLVLHGLGGKTQLSAAYVKLNIKDDDALKQSFARIARQVSRAYQLLNSTSIIPSHSGYSFKMKSRPRVHDLSAWRNVQIICR